ncbi:TetR/AcrR family transcriptional regulator [Tomitella biformata]|uniref:TetR/AcrR family transcriptional regulator n=1 Tax=Tomitella biformata TaxID=630403 RepID=UPI000466FF4A|nr:TetR/AcrR family transcriptional regulator [Tomitella biformata]
MPAPRTRRQPGRWVGQEPEDRRAARRAMLLEAGLQLMGTEGAAAATMRATCRQAGLTERYFYESFETRDDLVVAVLDAVVLGARDTLLGALADGPEDPELLVRHVIKAFTSYVARDRRRGRIMFVEAQSVPELQDRGKELIELFTAPLGPVLAVLSGAEEEPDAVTVQFNSIAIFGALAFLYQDWLTGSARISQRRIVEHVSQIIEAFARVDSTPI